MLASTGSRAGHRPTWASISRSRAAATLSRIAALLAIGFSGHGPALASEGHGRAVLIFHKQSSDWRRLHAKPLLMCSSLLRPFVRVVSAPETIFHRNLERAFYLGGDVARVHASELRIIVNKVEDKVVNLGLKHPAGNDAVGLCVVHDS
jgi:hypothetical protein